MLFAHSVLSLACAGTSAHEPHAARVTGANLSRGRSRRRLARGVHGAPGLTGGQVQRPVKSRQAVPGAGKVGRTNEQKAGVLFIVSTGHDPFPLRG